MQRMIPIAMRMKRICCGRDDVGLFYLPNEICGGKGEEEMEGRWREWQRGRGKSRGGEREGKGGEGRRVAG